MPAIIRDEAAPEYERVPREGLLFFQGDLKELSVAEYTRLKTNIEREGFFEPIEVWKDKEGKLWVMDGHQRLQVMDREGWKLPNGVPIRPMRAESREQAARRLLMINARYARITGQGLYEFMTEFSIDPVELANFAPAEIPYEPFVEEYFADPQEEGAESETEEEEDDPNDPRITPTGITELVEDAIMPSSNRWGIPDLREDMLFDDIDLIPTDVWTRFPDDPTGRNTMFIWSETRSSRFTPEIGEGGTLCFYEWDEKFETVWTSAVEAVRTLRAVKWGAIVEPDFSLYRDNPLAVQLWSIYRSRWVGRYWQEAGFKIIPNMGFADERSYEWAFCSIPKRPPVICAQMQAKGDAPQISASLYFRGLVVAIKELEPRHVILYTGSERDKEEALVALPKGPEYHTVTSWTMMRRIRYEARKKQAKPKGAGDVRESGV